MNPCQGHANQQEDDEKKIDDLFEISEDGKTITYIGPLPYPDFKPIPLLDFYEAVKKLEHETYKCSSCGIEFGSIFNYVCGNIDCPMQMITTSFEKS